MIDIVNVVHLQKRFNTGYLHRHNKATNSLHKQLAHIYNFDTVTKPYYKYTP